VWEGWLWRQVAANAAATADVIYKRFQAVDFAVYWNVKDKPLAGLEPSAELIHQMAEQISRSASRAGSISPRSLVDVQHQYIISPTDMEMNVLIRKTAPVDRQPLFSIDASISNLAIVLDQEQLVDLRAMSEWITLQTRRAPHIRFRPMCSLLQDKRGWWRYAIDAVTAQARRGLANSPGRPRMVAAIVSNIVVCRFGHASRAGRGSILTAGWNSSESM
jgi:hypothetical protein